MSFSLSDITFAKPLPQRVVIYGDSGVGKTTLAASAEKVLFMCLEEGLGKLTNVPCTPLLKTYISVQEVIKELLNQEHDFKTLVIDSIDWLAPLVHDYMLQSTKESDLAYGKEKNVISNIWIRFLNALDLLRKNKNITIVLICHAARVGIKCPVNGNYDQYDLKLPVVAEKLIKEWVDAGGFLSKYTAVDKEKGDFGKTSIKVKQNDTTIISFNSSGGFWSKNRSGIKDSFVVPEENGWQAISLMF